MRHVFFVKTQEADLARDMEKRLLELSDMSGILFVGVSVDPETFDSPPIYRVWIGCSREFDERTMSALVQNVFHEEIAKGLQVRTEAHCGIGRSRKRVDTLS